jgi:hypothetical protein
MVLLTPYREIGNYVVGFIVLGAYCAYGFVAVIFKVSLGVDVVFPASWEATMSNLAVATLSVLLDRQLRKNEKPASAPPDTPK